MKKITLGIVLVLGLFSCNKSEGKKADKKADKKIQIVTKTPVIDSLEKVETLSNDESLNDFETLLPVAYQTYKGKNPVSSLTEKWVDLYKQNGEYYLGKPDFKIENYTDDCSGAPLKVINSKKETLLFLDYPELKFGKINFIKTEKSKFWPKEKKNFTFNNINYTLRAEGEVLFEGGVITDNVNKENFNEVTNYKLYLTVGNGSEELIFTEDLFYETLLEILFVGDIDGDGKLDFVFSTRKNVEEECVILFLSSKAENENNVKKVSETVVQFDC
ncbi:hypothetical protein [Flavobacterium pectinovorum]|uniref:Lipoprotein n=1 Tax=Flavobacterium pectinovorum TaxID=29533 RepID=A0A502EWK8_9FLAO|nr:hypothetical protein [Flavobacterium pectinovorum]TPG42278.1 hypothetical protein EAH81_08160 [Flavobacterium pectinovorum]